MEEEEEEEEKKKKSLGIWISKKMSSHLHSQFDSQSFIQSFNIQPVDINKSISIYLFERMYRSKGQCILNDVQEQETRKAFYD